MADQTLAIDASPRPEASSTVLQIAVLAGLAAAIFAAQALVILMSPAVSLARQPDMVGDGPALRAC